MEHFTACTLKRKTLPLSPPAALCQTRVHRHRDPWRRPCRAPWSAVLPKCQNKRRPLSLSRIWHSPQDQLEEDRMVDGPSHRVLSHLKQGERDPPAIYSITVSSWAAMSGSIYILWRPSRDPFPTFVKISIHSREQGQDFR